MTIQFFGPYDFCSETEDVLADCPSADDAGIYLWAVEMPDGQYRISYIGVTTRSFYVRIKEHIIYQLDGTYAIYDPDEMRRGSLTVRWGGLWGKGRSDKLPQFLKEYEALAPLAREALYLQKLFVAPLQCEPRLLNRIEGAMAKAIRESGAAASLLPSDIRYQQRRTDEEPIDIRIDLPCVVQGLPAELAV